MNNSLNIITLNIPYPPDYGGMIDSYYRIKALNSLGIRIHLHCFQYGRLPSDELESLCETVNYYPRKSGFLHLFSSLPYIISTRQAKELLENLTWNGTWKLGCCRAVKIDGNLGMGSQEGGRDFRVGSIVERAGDNG